MSAAEDSDRICNVFQAGMEVTPIGEAVLLPEAEAEKWKPSDEAWWIHMATAPGQI
jgi:hypothetical protein